jgi:dihydropteroate synthase
VLAVDRGAAVVRVHDVRDTVAALAVWRAMKATEEQPQQRKEETT